MTRIVAIAAFILLAVVLIRYRTNKKVQYGVVLTFLIGLATYISLLVISELVR
ncbi:hypothetical protein R3X26_00090 [Vibrio sp. TH_r3]|uniref:hypothetical protein n=1 Tax=Vibrio sp. TH_r3 TaxID=3082084 RepID=UPI002953082D|nr:hypothetical protein [Vibrio sp. TH_r3]MDV7102800.1 hypothetical protein [Vibrio sp. TH_r3]